MGVCGDDKKDDVAEVEGPAARNPVGLDVFGCIVVVRAWGDSDPLRGEFGVALFEDERAEVSTVEVLAVGNRVDGGVTRDGRMVPVDREARVSVRAGGHGD